MSPLSRRLVLSRSIATATLGLGLVSLAACGDDRAAPLLVSSSATSADAKCADGGVTIQAGADANGNGVLDPGEVTSTQEVCSAGAPVIASLSAVGADAQCPDGGTLYQSGADTNGNGKLDPGEVTSAQEVCDSGATQLSVATALPLGAPACPLGGIETQTGIDDGANGGTPGDGILQPGEVTATTDVCTVATGYAVQPFQPPAALPGQPAYTIGTRGGAGSVGGGGGGGQINVNKSGTRGGHVKVFTTGDVDASFAMPAYTPRLGATPFVVATDTTVASYPDPTSAAIGEYYFVGSVLAYCQDAQHPQVPVTGIHVVAGATLTLPAVGMQPLTGDIVVDGTVTGVVSDGEGGQVVLSTTGVFVGGATGRVDTTGAVSEDRGGDGGTIAITAHWILNAAAMDSSGADAAEGGDPQTGGNAGSISLNTNDTGGQLPIYTTAALRAVGGRGAQGGASGNGATIQLTDNVGGLYVSGSFTAAGGDGRDNGAPGSGGFVGFNVYRTGAATTGGAIDIHGGDADAACSGTCAGGNGGSVQWGISGGAVRDAASVTVRGGRGVGAQGGNAGSFVINAYDGQDPNNTGPVLVGDIDLAGSLDLGGGDGTSGGAGGYMQIQQQGYFAPIGQEIRLFGYASVVTSGGAGVTSGGSAGGIYLSNQPSYGECCDFYGTGAVLAYPSFTATGGSASAGPGGNGGQVSFVSANGQSYNGLSGAELVLTAGPITTDGGDGTVAGGNSGEIDLRGAAGLQSSGAISARGGAASADGGTGGIAVNVNLRTGGPSINHSAIAAVGGASTGVGGTGGACFEVQLTATASLVTDGAISCTGGAGDTGGAGGTIWIQSLAGSSDTGVCTAAGGKGATPGQDGQVMVDGLAD